jgi:hypothetical protein
MYRLNSNCANLQAHGNRFTSPLRGRAAANVKWRRDLHNIGSHKLHSSKAAERRRERLRR